MFSCIAIPRGIAIDGGCEPPLLAIRLSATLNSPEDPMKIKETMQVERSVFTFAVLVSALSLAACAANSRRDQAADLLLVTSALVVAVLVTQSAAVAINDVTHPDRTRDA